MRFTQSESAPPPSRPKAFLVRLDDGRIGLVTNQEVRDFLVATSFGLAIIAIGSGVIIIALEIARRFL